MAIEITVQSDIGFAMAQVQVLATLLGNEARIESADRLISTDNINKMNANLEAWQDFIASLIPAPEV